MSSHALHHDPAAAAQALAEQEAQAQRETERRKSRDATFISVGRVLVSIIFIVNGLAKIATYETTLKEVRASGVSDAELLLPIAIAIELIGGAFLALGFKTRSAAIALMGYLALITVLLHSNLGVEAHRAMALANLAFIGGLVMLAAVGAGRVSVDRMLELREAKRFGLAT
jgi:putative oxidoreductase